MGGKLKTCGDILDRFPCKRCGADVPRACSIPINQRLTYARKQRKEPTA